ncbi:hypothetical protein [Klebsiella pneumoniae]|uniref:hypothetical protein n=1 Tax=Klebsiella pneumoniae TaxID=573 RepID=UPI0024A928A5|nr:hypothetical protein [Klebsiella pneumoniae]HBW6149023.1 hypothetical protein [Klebsiella pneumoniae]HDO7177696.1 hypothetical protein [Klebsiella pneumoniae]HDO7188143.1 hypothetical protein [Klebsiella pneumoniae]
MIQYIKINNTNQIQINDSGKQVYYSLLWYLKGRKTEISYGELGEKSNVSHSGCLFWMRALQNLGVIEIDDESSYLLFTLKRIETDSVEFIYTNY